MYSQRANNTSGTLPPATQRAYQNTSPNSSPTALRSISAQDTKPGQNIGYQTESRSPIRGVSSSNRLSNEIDSDAILNLEKQQLVAADLPAKLRRAGIHTKVVEINISNNPGLGTEGLFKILEFAASKRCSSEDLHLAAEDIGLTDDGCELLAQYIKNTPHPLKSLSLNIGKNICSMASVNSILTAIRNSASIRHIEVLDLSDIKHFSNSRHQILEEVSLFLKEIDTPLSIDVIKIDGYILSEDDREKILSMLQQKSSFVSIGQMSFFSLPHEKSHIENLLQVQDNQRKTSRLKIQEFVQQVSLAKKTIHPSKFQDLLDSITGLETLVATHFALLLFQESIGDSGTPRNMLDAQTQDIIAQIYDPLTLLKKSNLCKHLSGSPANLEILSTIYQTAADRNSNTTKRVQFS